MDSVNFRKNFNSEFEVIRIMKKEQYFRDKIRQFYFKRGRNFFWRRKKLSSFQIMVLELFLKKTRAETVNKNMYGFIKSYSNNKKILNESANKILKQIFSLGLGKQRTSALKEISKHIKKSHNNRLPEDVNKLKNIPFIGLYTSNAIACFGFNKRFSILDVNTSRIITRFFSIKQTSDLRNNKVLQNKAEELTPRKEFKEYNWGLLDLGAKICKTNPSCNICPLRRKCDFFNSGKFK